MTCVSAIEGYFKLGEGVYWDPTACRLLWVDIEGMGLFWSDDQRAVSGHLVWDEPVTFVAPVPGQRPGIYWVAVGTSVHTIDLEGREAAKPRQIVCAGQGVRLNDGAVGPDGALYIGTMAYDLRPGAGALFRMSANEDVICLVSGLTISNGLVWSKEGDFAFLIDTPTHTVRRYRFDRSTGGFLQGQNFIHIDDGFPDGMTIDSEQRLWIAHYNGWKVSVWDSLTGERLRDYPIPASYVTSCAIGPGEELFVTTARRGLTDDELELQPEAGSLFEVKSELLRGKGQEQCTNNHRKTL